MTAEPITFRHAGRERPARAEVVRYGSGERAIKACMFIVGGLGGGAACIIVPGLHLITTWALPLLGIVLGVRTLRTRVVVHGAAGECPACGAMIALPTGAPDDEKLRRCPTCDAALEVVVKDGHDPADPAATEL